MIEYDVFRSAINFADSIRRTSWNFGNQAKLRTQVFQLLLRLCSSSTRTFQLCADVRVSPGHAVIFELLGWTSKRSPASQNETRLSIPPLCGSRYKLMFFQLHPLQLLREILHPACAVWAQVMPKFDAAISQTRNLLCRLIQTLRDLWISALTRRTPACGVFDFCRLTSSILVNRRICASGASTGRIVL